MPPNWLVALCNKIMIPNIRVNDSLQVQTVKRTGLYKTKKEHSDNLKNVLPTGEYLNGRIHYVNTSTHLDIFIGSDLYRWV